MLVCIILFLLPVKYLEQLMSFFWTFSAAPSISVQTSCMESRMFLGCVNAVYVADQVLSLIETVLYVF